MNKNEITTPNFLTRFRVNLIAIGCGLAICFYFLVKSLFDDLSGEPSRQVVDPASIVENTESKEIIRVIYVRIGADINIGELSPVKLASKQHGAVTKCGSYGVYPHTEDKCLALVADGSDYPVVYESGDDDVWTVVKDSDRYSVVNKNGKEVQLGIQ